MKKQKYLDIKQKKLEEKQIEKVIYQNYKGNEFTDLDVDSNHPEKAFSSNRYYRAMKEVPRLQKKALFLSAVYDLTSKQIAQILNIKEQEVEKIKKQAITNFKRNLRKGKNNV